MHNLRPKHVIGYCPKENCKCKPGDAGVGKTYGGQPLSNLGFCKFICSPPYYKPIPNGVLHIPEGVCGEEKKNPEIFAKTGATRCYSCPGDGTSINY